MKTFSKIAAAFLFTHAVAFAFGKVQGVKMAWDSLEKQQRVLERYARKSDLASRP